MSRLPLYLGIMVALAFCVFAVVFFDSAVAPRIPATVVIPGMVPTSSFPSTATAMGTQATSTPEKISPPKNTHAPASATSEAPASAPIAVVPSPVSTQVLLDTSASALRNALVNIICTAPAGGALHSISGSGIIIDPKGIVLTNAHIGQYFLLADRGVSCVIRSGSPAQNRYNAALIYISPVWLRANTNTLVEELPNGTGEDDFTLLAISRSATADPLPASFPYVPLATTPSPAGTPVVIASYGAQFITSNQIASNLFPTIVFGSVKNVFTFGRNTIDVLALGGSAAAQEGSSGGGVADASGMLVGTITTSTISGATDTRALNAITASYIRAEYASEMGSALDLLLAESPASTIADFAPKIPTLESIITAHLP